MKDAACAGRLPRGLLKIISIKVLKIVTRIAELRSLLDGERAAGRTVGFVPTMGALHEGHASLVRAARSENDVVACSIFVNPTQFNDKSDLEHYPRTPEADRVLVEEAGCDVLFLPSVDEMYPQGEEEIIPRISWGLLDKVMEGAQRLGHFAGVVQIVKKLFDAAGPCKAYFGEKDFQQLAVIRRMAQDLQLPVEIVPCPTLRESDGLAMSSRNTRLRPEERAVAPLLSKALFMARELWPSHDAETIKEKVKALIAAEPRFRLDYFEIADADTLGPLREGQKNKAVACIAAYLGLVRLIDNVRLT